mmetsp:Transcript_35193/g.59011  ORF Transcript_35193/g.59011 Transcript_35193/m.59011 type:complete len:258 (-) Transcript_35193:838-1611(-)
MTTDGLRGGGSLVGSRPCGAHASADSRIMDDFVRVTYLSPTPQLRWYEWQESRFDIVCVPVVVYVTLSDIWLMHSFRSSRRPTQYASEALGELSMAAAAASSTALASSSLPESASERADSRCPAHNTRFRCSSSSTGRGWTRATTGRLSSAGACTASVCPVTALTYCTLHSTMGLASGTTTPGSSAATAISTRMSRSSSLYRSGIWTQADEVVRWFAYGVQSLRRAQPLRTSSVSRTSCATTDSSPPRQSAKAGAIS